MSSSLNAGSLTGLAHRHLHSGKVRELYAVGDDQLLLVATDRISAFDYVLPTEIPDKGAVLTALTLWWFEQLADVVPNHLLTARVDDYPAELAPHAEALRGRSMLCRRLEMVPVECVARGYLAGSGLNDYVATGEVCGHRLPPGLRDGDRLPDPIFTPATKADMGEHDENVSREQVARTVGDDLAAELERLTLAVYRRATELAEPSGLLVADTKFEFGRDTDGTLTLGDEVLTPDSSRFWPADQWEPGHAQPSYDKQYVRDWLLHESGWDRQGAPPALPQEVADRTRQKYVDAYERLTGRSFDDYLRSA
ncbi:MAG TPA: phosphoribosylaminoimidazolesuccinocarboxamide synthase [Mycobacteriales bacterium]|nr:phosphoribosylaminoimidazolesuccinocarboxamide synthase [Mycobacteriales bacterium]